ncbi:MAG: DUF3105 domain-containing protein [Patescibacteria group bacterium]
MKKSIWSWMIWILVVALIIGGMVGLIYWNNARPEPGQGLETQGDDHVSQAEIEAFSYNSNPPTSGPHSSQVTAFGVYDSPIFNGYQIHMLEHGGILIQYNTDDQAVVDQLRELTRELSKSNPRVALMPNPEIDQLIALTAWTHLENLATVDEAAIQEFFFAYVNRGPEKVDMDLSSSNPPADAPEPIELFQ